MPEWLGTSIVLAVVALLVGAVVYRLIRNKKQGRGGCSCGCEHCVYQCAKREQEQKEK